MLITGSGVAGLSLALRLADQHQVIVLGKGPVTEGSTSHAQGGIVAIFDETDNIDPHVEDTLIAGAGTCDRHAVELVASNARSRVQQLINQGVLFDAHTQPNGEESYHLIREGGHSHRRILHAADIAGREVEATLMGKAQNHPNVRMLECNNAVGLIVSDKIGPPSTQWVTGAWVWSRNKEAVETCHAKAMVPATGDASKIYQYTTNPDISSGDGIIMAWRTDCRAISLELSQLHPTVLYHPQTRNFLLTEALHGEDAYLKRPDGTRLMPDLSECGEPAPHNIVVRVTDHRMKRLGADCTFLDISHRLADFTRQYFPMIHEELLGLGIDLTKKPVPTVPAAYYTCGGVMVDDHGRMDVGGLYAIGEVSYTGLHGANRMAPNSLLECLVYGWSAAEDISRRTPYAHGVSMLPPWGESRAENPDERVVIQHNWHGLRPFTWDYADIVRATKRLARALQQMTTFQQEVDEYYAHFRILDNLLELRDLVRVAKLIIRCTMIRRKSRGLYFTLDYPELLMRSGLSILSAGDHYINR